MRESKKRRLREAYFGPLTLREVARESAVSEAWLERFWRNEKADGRIANVPRPHFAKFCKPAAERNTGDEDVFDDEVTGLDPDASPLYAPNPRFNVQCAGLLSALREHHPNLDNAAAQTAPREWFAFARKGAPQPTPAMLMRMCREHDQREGVSV